MLRLTAAATTPAERASFSPPPPSLYGPQGTPPVRPIAVYPWCAVTASHATFEFPAERKLGRSYLLARVTWRVIFFGNASQIFMEGHLERLTVCTAALIM